MPVMMIIKGNFIYYALKNLLENGLRKLKF